MFKELSDSVKANLYERTTSPLSGAFIVSWLVFNYQVVLTLFSSEDLFTKLTCLELMFSEPQDYAISILVPLAAALIYIFIYPWPAKLVYTYAAEKRKELHNERLKIEGEKLVSQDSYKRLRDDFYQQRASYTSDIDSLNEEIETLRKLLSEKSKSANDNSEAETPIKKPSSFKLTENEKIIMRYFKMKGSNQDDLSQIELGSGLNSLMVQNAVDKLIEKKLLKQSFNTVVLTTEGREFCLNNRF